MFQINEQRLSHMLKLKTHLEVVNTIDTLVDPLIFDTVRDDEAGWYVIVPKYLNGETPALCAHTDTVRDIHPEIIKKDGDVWSNANPDELLGADDRAGCYIIKELVKRKDSRYIYLIFDQEEVGGLGSTEFAKTLTAEILTESISCFIGLDRQGLNEVALYGYESEEFLAAIAGDDYFGVWRNEEGTFTDAANLAGDLNRCCVNFSVGYFLEHTKYETLNLGYLTVTINRLVNGLSKELYGTQFIPDETTQDMWNYYGVDSEADFEEFRAGASSDRDSYNTGQGYWEEGHWYGKDNDEFLTKGT